MLPIYKTGRMVEMGPGLRAGSLFLEVGLIMCPPPLIDIWRRLA